jgi:DNA primase
VFSFVMAREGLAFNETLRLLSDRAGVQLEWEGRSDDDGKAQKERDALSDLLEEAAVFYHQALLTGAEGEAARRVLAVRHVKPETAESFRLGYVPSRNGYLDSALKKGVPIERLLKAGLAVRSASGRFHDPMGGRLCFPIIDPYGRVVGFGGRVLGDEPGPKYLNSPETPLYTKSRQLYGLYQGRAALRDRGQAVLVEGYMDVVGCHQAGIKGAVAPLGTAFTREQAQLLKRYIQETVLLYDPDEAGIRASWRTAQVLLAEDLFVRVASIPDGLDPDEYAAQKGAGALASVIDKAQDVVDFQLDRLAAQGDAGLHGRLRQAEEIIGFIRSVPNAILQEEWLKKTARRLSLEESSLRRELDKKGPAPAPAKQAAPAAPPRPPAPVPAAAPKRPGRRIRSAEEEALQLLASKPGAMPEGLTEDLFADPRCRAAFLARGLVVGPPDGRQGFRRPGRGVAPGRRAAQARGRHAGAGDAGSGRAAHAGRRRPSGRGQARAVHALDARVEDGEILRKEGGR